MFGYFTSQVIRSRTARPFGFDKLPSPKATPIIKDSVDSVPEVGLEPTWLAPRDFESRMYTNFITPAGMVVSLHIITYSIRHWYVKMYLIPQYTVYRILPREQCAVY